MGRFFCFHKLNYFRLTNKVYAQHDNPYTADND